MATDRSPIAYLWPTIKAFATGDVITRELLRDSINKAGDIGYGVLAALNERFQQLGSTNAGTSAVQRGSVVMGTLSFYDPVDVPVGALDGLTLILETDLAGPVTVTFAQPTSPVHVATQINTQAAALGLVATCDTGVDPNTGAVVAANVGKLLLVRPSGASADLIVKGAGTANAILGLPLIDTTVSGAGTVNDGASRIGVGAFGSWAGGTLQSYLSTIASSVAADIAAKVAKAGDTMTGALTTPNVVVSDTSNTVTVVARNASRSIEGVLSADPAKWSAAATGRFISLVDTGAYVIMPLGIPHGAMLVSLSVSYVGAGGHAALPGVMPNVTIYKTLLSTGVDTTISTTSDTSVSTGAFQAVHAFGPSGLSEVIDRSIYRYSIAVGSEAGSNALAGGVLFGVKAMASVTRIDEF